MSRLHIDIVEYPKDKIFVAECLEIPIFVQGRYVGYSDKENIFCNLKHFQPKPLPHQPFLTTDNVV